MISVYLKDKFRNIDNKVAKSKQIGGSDPEIAAMMSSYLAVFISGIYEDCIEYLFKERAGRNKDSEIQNFVENIMDKDFRNPNYEKIRDFLKYLNETYGDQLDKLGNEYKDALNSIVNNKNQIAHGGTCNATINDIITYHKKALKIFEELEKILL